MSYQAKIMGTRYIIELQLEYEQWYLRLKVDQNIEEEVELNNFTKSGLNNALEDLISRINLEVHDFQRNKILDDLINKTSHLFAKQEKTSREKTEFEEIHQTNRSHSPEAETSRPKNTTRHGGESYALQQRLLSEYRNKLSTNDKLEVKQININELEHKNNESDQLKELVKSHEEIQQTLKQLDQRVAGLERVTTKLVEITEIILEG